MNKKNLITIIFGALIISGCGEKEQLKLVQSEDYLFEPATIVSALRQSKTDVLIPVEDLPLFPPTDEEARSVMNWGQDEYQYLFQSVFPIIWGEPLDGWALTSMDFNLNCAYAGHGFQQASFSLFRVQDSPEENIRIERKVTISLRRNSVHILERTYIPALAEWETINLPNLNYTADKALQLAEEQGGREKRLAVSNNCEIFVLLSPDSASYAGWLVGYTQPGVGEYLFSLWVDPFTGE